MDRATPLSRPRNLGQEQASRHHLLADRRRGGDHPRHHRIESKPRSRGNRIKHHFLRRDHSSVSWQIRNGIYSNRLRPPYGAYNSRVSSIAGSLGYRICTWTIDTKDWQYVNGSRRSTSSIRYIVRNSPWSAKASGVVLGHLNTNYPDAMSGIISDLHTQGLLFCRNRGPVGSTMPFPASCT